MTTEVARITEELARAVDGDPRHGTSVMSPDGRTLAYILQTPETGDDVYTISLKGEPQPRPVVQTSG